MSLRLLLSILLVIAVSAEARDGGQLVGAVTRVRDGDTIEVAGTPI